MFKTVEAACERFLAQGPIRLAIYMLIGILIAPIPSAFGNADAHDTTITAACGDDFCTDNYVRWGLGHGMTWGEVNLGASSDFLDSWPPTPPGLLDSDTMIGIASLVVPGTGVAAYTTICCDVAQTNKSMINFTWENPIPITNFQARFTDDAGKTGTALFGALFYDDAGLVIQSLQTSASCADAAVTTLTGSFDEILVKSVYLYYNDVGCAASPASALNINGITIFNVGNKTAAIAYHDKQLEYADWMGTRDALTTPGGGGTFTFNGNSINKPANVEGFLFGGGSFSSCSPAWAIPWAMDFVGLNVGTNAGFITVWKMGTSNTSRTINFTAVDSTSRDCPYFLPNTLGLYYANTFQTGGVYPDGVINAVPKISNFTPSASTQRTMAHFYKNNSGAMGTTALSGAHAENLNFDLPNATAVALADQPALANPKLWVNLTAYTTYGNAIIFNLASIGTAQTCDSNSVIRVNGATTTTRLAWNDFVTLGDSTFWFCFWVLDDFSRTQDVPSDVNGNNQYLDNSRTGTTRRYFVEVENYPIAGATITQHYTLQRIDGKFAERLACHSDRFVCFGDLHTAGFAVPQDLQNVTWNWRTLDETTEAPVNSTRILELMDSVAGATNVNGNLTLNTFSPVTNWSVSHDIYNGFTVNFTDLIVQEVNMTVFLSRDSSKIFPVTICTPTTLGFNCNVTMSNEPSQTCPDYRGSTGGCLHNPAFGSGFKIYQFACPADISTSTPKPIQNVSFFDALSGEALVYGATSFGTNNDLGPMDCLASSTSAIQSSTIEATFTKFGYRTIEFDADWLTSKIVRILVLMKKGEGTANVRVDVLNTTTNFGGVPTSAMFITLTDTAPAAPTGLSLGPAQGILNMANALGFVDEASKILFAIAIMVGVFLLLRSNIFVCAIIELVLFILFAFLGFFPGWMVFVVLAFAVGLGALGFLGRARSFGE